MSHITSSWAREYGLPDPGETASEIMTAAAGFPDAAARLFNAMVLALRFGHERARVALAAVESGWSTPRPHDAVRKVMTLSTLVEQACQDTKSACGELSAAIAKAHADVATAYAAADSAIAAMNLGSRTWTVGPDELVRVDRERCALVWNLHAAISSIASSLDEAATRAAASMNTDPETALPPPPPGPAASRNTTNLAVLRDDLRAPTGHRHYLALAVNSALQQAQAAGYTAQLLRYDSDDPAGQGGVAIAIGDVARATSVSVLVPGVGNSPTGIADSFGLADALNRAADHAGGPGSSAATVVWLGYDVPLTATKDGAATSPYDYIHSAMRDSFRATDATDAIMSGGSLAAFVHGLRAVANPAANLTLIGHSYGSTTVAQATRYLTKDAGVDDVVLLASPGVGYGITNANDMRAVDPDHVFSLSFPFDPVPALGASGVVAAMNPVGQVARRLTFGADLGPFGPDPARGEFGGNVITAPSNEPVDSAPDFDQHALSNYLSGSSLDAVGAVAAARYRQVPVQARHP
jgi:hypothetical protein